MEDVGVTGDVILRLKVQTASTTCTPNCGDKVCGDDGCGGSCGVCADGLECRLGFCVPTDQPDEAGGDTGLADEAVVPDAAADAMVTDEGAADVQDASDSGPGDPADVSDPGEANPDAGPYDPGTPEVVAEVESADVDPEFTTPGRSSGGCAAGTKGGGPATPFVLLVLLGAFVRAARVRRWV